MFSKQEAAQLKKEFWTAFGKAFPRKWLLYDTKIKDFSFKFSADNKKAEVSLDIEMKDELFRNAYFEKIQSLEDLLRDEIGDFEMDEHFVLENVLLLPRIEWSYMKHQPYWPVPADSSFFLFLMILLFHRMS